MSWWVYLEDRAAPHWCSYGTPPEDFQPEFEGDEPCPEPCYPAVEVTRHASGGTYMVGGTISAELNITYNYGPHFHEAIDGGLERLNGITGREALPLLTHAVDMLGAYRSDDYWEASPGNAGYSLSILLEWARQYPEAVFRIN
jgi:hypothetical protein